MSLRCLLGTPARQAAGGVPAQGEQQSGHEAPRRGACGEPAAAESDQVGAGHQQQGSAGELDQRGAGSHSAAEGERMEAILG